MQQAVNKKKTHKCIFLFLFIFCASCVDTSDSKLISLRFADAKEISIDDFADAVQIFPIEGDVILSGISEIRKFDSLFVLVDDDNYNLAFLNREGKVVKQILSEEDSPVAFSEITSFSPYKEGFVVSDGTDIYIYNSTLNLDTVYRQLTYIADKLHYSSCGSLFSFSDGKPYTSDANLTLAAVYQLSENFEPDKHFIGLEKESNIYNRTKPNIAFVKEDTIFASLDHLHKIYYKTCSGDKFEEYINFEDHLYLEENTKGLNSREAFYNLEDTNPFSYINIQLLHINDERFFLKAVNNQRRDFFIFDRHSESLQRLQTVTKGDLDEVLISLSLYFPSIIVDDEMHTYIPAELVEQLQQLSIDDPILDSYDKEILNYFVKIKLK